VSRLFRIRCDSDEDEEVRVSVQIVPNFLCNVLKADDINDDDASDDDDKNDDDDDVVFQGPYCAQFPVQCAQSRLLNGLQCHKMAERQYRKRSMQDFFGNC